MNSIEIENLEIELLLDAVYKRYGYDFRGYARASIKRRIVHFLSKTEFDRPTAMIPKLLDDSRLMARLVYSISVPVTEMFRDPQVYAAIRKQVVPVLATYPFIKIWHAGCATGQEAYSIAILLHEEGLFNRTQMYATDLNDEVLAIAKEGIYPAEQVRTYAGNYARGGGRRSLSDYYHSQYASVIMDSSLKKIIVFANHNLAADASFGEVHLIVCRNVLIYFQQELQNRALKLFYDSLIHRGFLCLGTKENIRFSDYRDHFVPVDEEAKIYQKV